MKKRLVTILLLAFTATSLVACGSSSNVAESTADTTIETEVATVEPTATPEPTEAPHEHSYVETITTEPTCETDGEALYACECGDSYTEPIATQGHVFETYTSNNDATFTADGTETATCSNCDVTDTRTAEGSILTYTYTDVDATMYAQKTVNVRSMPNTDGEKLGSLSTNDEVKVTGQCAETSWYRIEYSGGVAYVSDSYLGNDKVVVQTEAPAQSTSSEFPYQLWTVYNDGTVAWFYMPGLDHGYPPEYATAYNECMAYNRANFPVVDGQMPGFHDACYAAGSSGDTHPDKCKTEWYVNGKRVWRYFAV
uniref:SH3 domain-containing protein n=1 Tax=Acetatifactor sp. TaxID=1872090 RepID=UPI004057743A